MPELADLLVDAPRRAPFTSDDVCVFRRGRDSVARGGDAALLLLIASSWRAANPRGSYNAFTRYLVGILP